MNEKKILWIRKGSILPLTIDETNRISQLAFHSYSFCRAFHGGPSEKKYYLSVQRYLQNFFENLTFQKTCLAFL